MIRQGAWGSFSDTADMRPPITRQQQGYTELALCLVNPKPLSAYGTFPYCATPKGLANTVGAAHTRVRHVAGVQGNLLHPYTQKCRLQPGQAPRGCFASLTGFQLRPLRLVLLPHGDGEGVKGDEVVHFTLDALNRPNTHRRGRWIGFATCPAASCKRVGFGAKPQGLVFLFLKLLGGCNRSKGQKNVHF